MNDETVAATLALAAQASATARAPIAGAQLLPITLLKANTYNPRKRIDAKALDELGNAAPGSPEFKRLLTEYHSALMENLPYIPVGEFNSDSAWRKDRLEYTSTAPYVLFWNMVRK